MDEQRGKMTWPSLVGVEAAQKKSRELWTQAEEALAVFGDSAWFLARICRGAGKEKEVRNRGSKCGGYITGDHHNRVIQAAVLAWASRRRSKVLLTLAIQQKV